MRSKILLFFFMAFLGGVLLASFLKKEEIINFLSWDAGLGVIILILSLTTGIWRKYRSLILAIFLGFLIGLGRFFFSIPSFGPDDVAFYKDALPSMKVRGFIAEEVDVRPEKQYLTLETQTAFFHQKWSPIKGKILIKAPRYPEFAYGDLLEVDCHMESPPTFEKFSYADVLAKSDIYVVCYKPWINLLEKGKGSMFWGLVFQLKNLFSSQINKLFSEPEASIVAGVLMGIRRGIPENVLNDFNTVGLTHILAISGYNITLMITIFGLLFQNFNRSVRFFGIVGGILLFLLFTGFSSSVVRAAWMGIIVVIALRSGRKTNGLLVLLMSAFVMVFINPRMLVWDLSFELSFTATLGLILVMPLFEKFFQKIPFGIGENLAVTFAAQVFTTPIILYYFGRFSLISPLSNILFLPLIPWIMLFSFIALVVSFLISPLAVLFAAVAWLFLKILIVGVSFVAKVPYASLEI